MDRGIIFYLAGPGEDLDGDGIADHGLVAAPSDQSTGAAWGCFGMDITGADDTGIGTGVQNTADIEAGCTTTGIAADLCANLILSGYDEWFLPSRDELNLMYTNLRNNGNLGGFTSDFYWSSTENGSNFAWVQAFGTGVQFEDFFTKLDNVRVRAARVF